MHQLEVILLAGLVVAGFLLAQRKISGALLILFWAHSALTSVRHATVFVVVASPYIAVEFTRMWRTWVATRPPKSLARIIDAVSIDAALRPVWTGPWSVVFVLFLAVSSSTRWPQDFPAIAFPAAIVGRHPDVFSNGRTWPRILSSDHWGGYLIFRFYPNSRVFIDGRSDFYGEEYSRGYVRMVGGGAGWQDEVNRHGFDYALLPADWSLTQLLRADSGWRLMDQDNVAVLFQRVKR